MKTIKYNGRIFPVKLIINETVFLGLQEYPPQRYRFVIDPWTIDIKPYRKDIKDACGIFAWKPPVEISSLYNEDSPFECYFSNDGNVIPEANIACAWKKNSMEIWPGEMLWPDYVGFFELPEGYERKDYIYGYERQEFFYIPIPIQCAVRDMTPEERLLLSHDEKLTDTERKQKEESEEARQKRKEKMAILRANAALTLKEALKKWIKFDIPGVAANTRARIKEAVMLYSQPEFHSLSKVAKAFNVTPKTVSTWLKTFTDKTGFPVVQYEKHQSVRAQAEIQMTTGAKRIPKRLSSDM